MGSLAAMNREKARTDAILEERVGRGAVDDNGRIVPAWAAWREWTPVNVTNANILAVTKWLMRHGVESWRWSGQPPGFEAGGTYYTREYIPGDDDHPGNYWIYYISDRNLALLMKLSV
jgi:hypothetical protein